MNIDTFLEQLGLYFQSEGFVNSASEQVMEKSTKNLKRLYGATRLALHFMGVKTPGINNFGSDTNAAEFDALLQPLRDAALFVGHKFSMGAVQVAIVVAGDDAQASEVLELAKMAESTALACRKFAAHRSALFIKQQAAAVIFEIYFVFASNQAAETFKASLFKQCFVNHAFKMTTVSPFILNVEAKSVSCLHGLSVFRTMHENKLRKKLFSA